MFFSVFCRWRNFGNEWQSKKCFLVNLPENEEFRDKNENQKRLWENENQNGSEGLSSLLDYYLLDSVISTAAGNINYR